MSIKTYTVIGVYEGDGQAFADYVQATDQYLAMGVVGSRNADTDLLIIGAVEGEHQLLTPGEDNNSAAYAVDMADLA